MYKTSLFQSNTEAAVIEFIKAHPFIHICGVDEQQMPVVAQVPIIVVEKNNQLFFKGHFMRKQNHTIAFEQNPNVLAVFTSPSAYISASWYTTKNVASTWNYQSVHCKGIIRFTNDDELHTILTQLTHQFEQNEQSEAAVKNMTPEYIAANMKAIVGFEMEVTQIDHVFKLSQNKTEIDRKNIIEALKKGNASEQYIANEMEKIKPI